MQSLRNGTILGGYTLIRMLARGGMGEVYEAYEAKLQRKVALKVIAPSNPDEYDRDDLVRRFMQEARTLARVNHPNVVTIYSIDNDKGTPFIAMEYVEGVSFRHLLETLTFTVDGALPLFIQMLEGLKSLHDNRIVHRDLKPHNILLRPDGQIKILDFGIAKHVGSHEHTRAGVIVGTLPYMAPELKNGVTASMRSDIWSLGAIFFECLVGKRLVECIPDRDIEYPEDCNVPEEFRQILNKMCAHKTTDRYLAAEHAIEDIRRFMQTRPPVPSSVWTNLAKKIEALAEAQRTVQDLVVPPSNPRPGPATELIKAGRVELQDPLPPPPSMRTNTEFYKTRVQTPVDRRRYVVIGIAIMILVLGFILHSQNEKPNAPDRSTAQAPTTPATTSATPPPVVSPAPTQTPSAPPPVAPPVEEKITLKDPPDQQLLWLEPTRIPRLIWSRPLISNQYEIQIATDARFKKIIMQEPVTGTSFRPDRVLAEGHYFWRLWPRKKEFSVVGPSSFTVSLLNGVELLSPDHGRILDPGTRARLDVDFKWNCKLGANAYLVQIASDLEFNNLVQEKTLNRCDWKGAMLTPGSYYWRVRLADVRAAQNIWTKPRLLTIRLPQTSGRPRSDFALQEPRPKRAQQTFALSFTSKPRDIASLSRTAIELPKLEWRPVRGAVRYNVQFSSTRDFATLIGEDFARETHLNWKGIVPGRTFWRVSALGQSGEQSAYSSPAEIMIMLPAPKIDGMYKFMVPASATGADQVTIDWPSAPFVSKYLVQIGPSRDLAGTEERLTKDSLLSISNLPGKSYIRIAAATDSGEALSPYSTVAAVEIETTYALEKPSLLSPKAGARAPSKNGRISIVFAWSRVPSADGYIFEVSLDSEFKKVIERRDSKNRGLLLQQVELQGRVYWRVRATSTQGSSDWSESSYFDVK